MLSYLLYFLNIGTLALSIVGISYFGKIHLGTEDFESWLLLSSFIGLLNVADLGVSRFISREIAFGSPFKSILPGSLIFHFIALVCFYFIFLFAVLCEGVINPYLFTFFTLSIFVKFLTTDLLSYFYGKDLLLLDRGLRLVQNFSVLVVSITVMKFFKRLDYMLYSQILVQLFVFIFCMKKILLLKRASISNFFLEWKYHLKKVMLELRPTSIDYVLSSLPVYFIMGYGVVFIKERVSGEEFQFWGVVSQINSGILVSSQALALMSGPKLSVLYKTMKFRELKSLFIKNFVATFLLVLIGIAFTGYFLEQILDVFRLTHRPSSIFKVTWSLFILFEATQMVFASFLIRIGFTRFYPYVITSSVTNIVLLHLLTPMMGVDAVILSLLVCQCLTCYIFIPKKALHELLKGQ